MNDVMNESLTAKRSASPDAVVDRLFQRLHTIYGRAWADMWVGAPMDEVKAEWARSLDGFEVETVRLALESLKTEGVKFPPNLAEFVHLCRQFVRRGPHRLALMAPRYVPPADVFKNLKKALGDERS